MAGVNKASLTVKIAVSALILYYIFRKIDLATLTIFYHRISAPHLVAAAALIPIAQMVRAARLSVLVFGKNISGKLYETFRIQMVSFLPGLISPARIGEASKAYMLQRSFKITTKMGVVYFLAERAFDIGLLLILSSLGLWRFHRAFLFKLAKDMEFISFMLAVACGLIVLCALLFVKVGKEATKSLREVFTPGKLSATAMISVVYWLSIFVITWLLCMAASAPAGFLDLLSALPLALLAGALPISLAGFGIREGTMIFYLQRINLSFEGALLVSVIYGIVGIGLPALMGTLFLISGKRKAKPVKAAARRGA